MSTLLTVIPKYSFAAEFPDIEISSDASIDFMLKQDGNVVINETYNPDVSNKIVVRDICSIMQTCLYGKLEEGTQEKGKSVFELFVAGASVGTSTVCSSNYIIPGANCADSTILTRAQSDVCYMSYVHLLTFLGVVTAKLMSVTGTTLETVTFGAAGVITTKNCNPVELFGDKAKDESAAYIIYSTANRTMTSNISKDADESYTVLRYLNAYDMPESLLVRGGTILKPGITSVSSNTHGKEIKYNVTSNDEYTAKSGALNTRDEYQKWRDLAMTRNAQILWQGIWYDIVIDKPNYSQSMRRSEWGETEINYRMAKEKENGIINL